MTPEAQVKAAVAGLKVRYFKRWNDPKIAGFGDTTWTPRFVMLHHTAGTKSLGGLSTGAFGAHKPVPGANFLVNRDGSVEVLSRFITYHAGKGGPKWGVAKNMMNPVCWGIEIEDLGVGQTMTPAQIDATAALAAGLLKAMGKGVDALVQHKAWSSSGKVDTRYSDDFWRGRVAEKLNPAPAPVVKEDAPIEQDDVHPLTKLHDTEVAQGEWVTFATDHIAAKPGVEYLLTVQFRRAADQRLQTRVARLGWGAEAKAGGGVDATFYEDEPARSYASSHSFSHPIKGGGDIAFQVRLSGGSSVVPTLIAKVTPISLAE